MQIVFCVLACLCVAAVVPVGIFCEPVFVVIPLAGALLFGGAMYFAKKKSAPPPPKEKDFMDGE